MTDCKPDAMEAPAALPTSRSIPDLAKAHGLSTPTVWREIQRNRLKVHRLGRRTFVLIDDERAWLKLLEAA